MRLPTPRTFDEYIRRTPTTDLYLNNPMRRLLAGHPGRLPPTRTLSPNLYMIGRTGIVSRYGSAADLERLSKAGARRLIYIADDDFEAGAVDPLLPARYRARLAAFAEGDWPVLKSQADAVVVSSPPLAAVYGAKARFIHPAWALPPATTEHFRPGRRIELVHLGTGSHGSDFAPLTPVLAGILRRNSHVRLTLFAGSNLPEALKGLPQVRSLRPLSWWRYKIALRRMRFHLALYRLQPTPFNAARSANKLFEQAIVGAASLMSLNPALQAIAGETLPDVFVEGGPDIWRDRIEASIADLEDIRERAERTRRHILALDPLGQAARHWLELLADEL